MQVDLPDPLPPRSAWIDPPLTSKLTFDSARIPGKVLESDRTLTLVAGRPERDGRTCPPPSFEAFTTTSLPRCAGSSAPSQTWHSPCSLDHRTACCGWSR